jgi:drug/metabolite transporter (DMT)-like permease
VAKGLVTVLVGVLVVVAAVQFEPQRANGLDAALKTLAAQPFGVVLLVATAVGLVAFGVFCAFDARYHRV